MYKRFVASLVLLLIVGCSTSSPEVTRSIPSYVAAEQVAPDEVAIARSIAAMGEFKVQLPTAVAFTWNEKFPLPAKPGTDKVVVPLALPEPSKTSLVLNKGNFVYFVPSSMVVGKMAEVDLWVDRRLSLDALQLELAKKLNLDRDRIRLRVQGKDSSNEPVVVAGTIEGRTGWVGDHMQAELSGGEGDFTIFPKGPVKKSLLADGRATWNWHVTPKRASSSEGMPLYIDVLIDQGIDKESFPTIHETVTVPALVVPPPSLWQRILGLLTSVTTQLSLLNTLLGLLGIAGIGGLTRALRTWLRRMRARDTPLPTLHIPHAEHGEIERSRA